jgi:hypothetical protein
MQPQYEPFNMHQVIMQAHMKRNQERQEKIVSAVQQVLKQYDEHGNPTETKSETQFTSTKASTKTISNKETTSKSKKQKILNELAKELDLDSESDHDSESTDNTQTELLIKTQKELKRKQTELKKAQQEIVELKKSKTLKTSTKKRSQRPSPSPPTIDISYTSDSDDEENGLTPEQQRQYDEKYEKLVSELTEKYSGRGAAIKKALEDEAANFKIMPDHNRRVLIQKLATALMR